MQDSPSRTWSTDTYSVAESNPDSGASSGVSSPRDSQSYENVQGIILQSVFLIFFK